MFPFQGSGGVKDLVVSRCRQVQPGTLHRVKGAGSTSSLKPTEPLGQGLTWVEQDCYHRLLSPWFYYCRLTVDTMSVLRIPVISRSEPGGVSWDQPIRCYQQQRALYTQTESKFEKCV